MWATHNLWPFLMCGCYFFFKVRGNAHARGLHKQLRQISRLIDRPRTTERVGGTKRGRDKERQKGEKPEHVESMENWINWNLKCRIAIWCVTYAQLWPSHHTAAQEARTGNAYTLKLQIHYILFVCVTWSGVLHAPDICCCCCRFHPISRLIC